MSTRYRRTKPVGDLTTGSTDRDTKTGTMVTRSTIPRMLMTKAHRFFDSRSSNRKLNEKNTAKKTCPDRSQPDGR